jgi:ParB/RepB/Spo0J family partition protein
MPARSEITRTLPITQIRPSSMNPRRSFNPAADDELYDSIKAHGILTPLLVRPVDGTDTPQYEVVAGHRRLMAAQEINLPAVPVTVRELSDDEAREAALIENLHRENLAPLDEAESYQALLLIPGATAASVAAAVGKSPAYIGRRMRLLFLVDDAKGALREGRLDVARAELLAKLTTDVQARALTEEVWLPMFSGDGEEGTLETLRPLADLRAWVERRTRLEVADLVDDTDTRELFPEAAEAVSGGKVLLEVALDRFSQSPAKADIPPGVLRLNKDFREVTGKKCKFALPALVVFGERRGDVVSVCCEKKGPTTCAVHWPAKPKADQAQGPATRMSWQEEQAQREHQRKVWDTVRPAVWQAVVAGTTKIKTTPQMLREVLEDRCHRDEFTGILKAVGTITPATFGRAYTLVTALTELYDADGAAKHLKTLGVTFDVKKALAAAEAQLITQKAAAAAEAKKPKPAKAAKKGRAA